MSILDEVENEGHLRRSQLMVSRDMLAEAKFTEVLTDGMDIFNAEIEAIQARIDDLIGSIKPR
jgi:hypothetical protein